MREQVKEERETLQHPPGFTLPYRRSPPVMASLSSLLGSLDRNFFVPLLSKLIGESRLVQNNLPDLVPQQDLVARHFLDVLLPLSTYTGSGPLIISHVTYTAVRDNVIVEYPGTMRGRILSFVGWHMDVVTADPAVWVIGNVRTVQEFVGEEKAVSRYRSVLIETYEYEKKVGLAKGPRLGSLHCVLFCSWALLVWFTSIIVHKNIANGGESFTIMLNVVR